MSDYRAPQTLYDLAFRYALAVDKLDAAMLLPLFTDDGVVCGYGENPIHFQGPDDLTRMIAQVGSTFQKTMHNVFNQTFEQAADGSVSGETNCIASHIMPGDNWMLLDMAIRYHNRYACINGDWKFSERRLEIIWVETRPVQKFQAAMMNADLKDFR